ncbi:dephospho-CoA kinase [Alicyclobacillus tolerans]|uniref:dephospho-CoA kinase n=1 Tax=Alicyclobacillus tolerans TaxID=90970 RepID=UPI001EED0356|nr:dephospho-CoA kinase [Alicyclobacillus tolerans]MCF8566215.1 dephospho-CoA kinase [Alicyclobacillus tolerans]
MIVGLTGGIATGKSTVTNMLRELDAYVVDADEWARRVVEPGAEALTEIAQEFGETVLNPDGTLNRAALGEVVFTDVSARQRLNAITHPRIRNGMLQETMEFVKSSPNMPIVWDVPLLFEGETKNLVDLTVLVYATPQLQLTRLMERNGYSLKEAKARIAAQMPIDEKRQFADYIIDNSGTQSETKEQVQKLWTTLLDRARQG